MAIINQYKATYPSETSRYENDDLFINATSMKKAVEMSEIEKGSEPIMISKLRDNVMTETTEETTVFFQIKSYIDSETEEEIEIPDCAAYPTSVPNCKRGSVIYIQAPNYNFMEGDVPVTYTFEKWVYDNEEWTNNPQQFAITYDESIESVIVKAIYSKS